MIRRAFLQGAAALAVLSSVAGASRAAMRPKRNLEAGKRAWPRTS
jgi:FtsP/CotA-like multicopper oxidase with cupredoxin domain